MKIFIIIAVVTLSVGIPTWFFSTYQDSQAGCLQAEQKTAELTAKKSATEEKIKQLSAVNDDNEPLNTAKKKAEELKNSVTRLNTENTTLKSNIEKIRQGQSNLQREQADINALYKAVSDRSARKKS